MEQSRVQKLTTVPQTVKEFLAFCGSRRFNIIFTKVRLLPSSWDRINPNHVPPFYLFGMYFHIPFSSRPQSHKCLFLSDFFIKHFVIPLSHISVTCHHSHNKGTLKIKKKDLFISYSKIKKTEFQNTRYCTQFKPFFLTVRHNSSI